jgi:riboflavin kinase/FMN adenylyltransferase
VRAALAAGDLDAVATLLGRPYSISGHVLHGRKLGRALGASGAHAGDGFRTLNLRFGHPKPAAMGIFVVRVHGLGERTLDGVASLGRRPTVDESGRVLLEVHCFDWPRELGPEGGYGRLVRVELLHKLRDEARYDSLAELTQAIGRDAAGARAFLAADAAAHAATGRQTTRDRI